MKGAQFVCEMIDSFFCTQCNNHEKTEKLIIFKFRVYLQLLLSGYSQKDKCFCAILGNTNIRCHVTRNFVV